MNGKLLILLVSLTAAIGLSGCSAVNCPAEFARPKSKELLCGSTGNVMSTGSEVYITPAQYQEWRRQNTPVYAPQAAPAPVYQTPSYPAPAPSQSLTPSMPEPMAPASTSQIPPRAAPRSAPAPEPEMIEG